MTAVLSVAEVCVRLGCKRTRVFQLLGDGVLERAPRFGRELRVYEDSVTRALARPEPRTRRRRAARGEGPEVVDVRDLSF